MAALGAIPHSYIFTGKIILFIDSIIFCCIKCGNVEYFRIFSGDANTGSASALLGVTSFALGGFVSPLVVISGGHTAIPMHCNGMYWMWIHSILYDFCKMKK